MPPLSSTCIAYLVTCTRISKTTDCKFRPSEHQFRTTTGFLRYVPFTLQSQCRQCVSASMCQCASHCSQRVTHISKTNFVVCLVFGRPYYRSCLRHTMSSVCLSVVCLSSSVTFCIVAIRYVLAKNCLKE